jgi:superoxide reductase
MPWDKLFGQINTPADPNNMNDLEKKHLPVIDAPDSVKAGECFQVKIEVGKLHPHPNEKAHYIEFIELYADRIYLGRVHFTAETTCPTATFCVALPGPVGELRAYERCNMHGVWEYTKAINVQE